MSVAAADTIFHVSDLAGLNAALRSMAGGSGGYTIALAVPDGTLRLDEALLAVNLAAGARLTIEGNGATIDGLGAQRGLMVLGGTVEVRNLAIANALARGGDGGSGFYGGGGGAGLGGGLFVGAAGVVTLRGVGIKVSNEMGQITLAGAVEKSEWVQQAQDIASQVAGVRGVTNRLVASALLDWD